MLKVNDKVKPIGWTKDNLSYGFIRSHWIEDHVKKEMGQQICWVYWPEIKSSGRWPANELKKI